ncbi:hypothetical protein AALB16_07395 [Lachnospiraceae bacterium 62-35]
MADMFNALILFGLLLVAGVIIRELVPPFQKFLLPASLIGGFFGLILGQQVLGVVEIPTAFSEISSFGMRIIMTCVPIGVSVSAKRIYEHLDFTFANMTLYGFQMIFGVLLGALFCTIWPGLPEGWGLMGVAAYFGSHGNIPVVSEVIDPTGELGAQSLGMVLATLGVLFAIIPGMAMANYGARRGWAVFTHDLTAQPKYFYRGTLPEDKREALGKTTVNPSNVTGFAFQLGILAVCYKFGELLFKVFILFIPFLARVSPMLYGLIGGLIIWPILNAVKLDKYVDKPTITQISNLALEMIILGACATIQLDIVSRFFAPLLLHALIFCSLTFGFVFFWMKKIGHPQWFEKGLMVYGMATGSNPQGFALVRSVDPNNQSCIFEALGVYNAVFFWNFLIQPFAAALVLVNRVPIYIVGAGLMCTSLVGAFLFSREKSRGGAG